MSNSISKVTSSKFVNRHFSIKVRYNQQEMSKIDKNISRTVGNVVDFLVFNNAKTLNDKWLIDIKEQQGRYITTMRRQGFWGWVQHSLSKYKNSAAIKNSELEHGVGFELHKSFDRLYRTRNVFYRSFV